MSEMQSVPDSVRLEVLPGGRFFINPSGPAVLGFFDHLEIGAELIRRFNAHPEMTAQIAALTAERDALKQQLHDEALAFNHANELVGKYEADANALTAENARLAEALRQIISDFESDYVLDGVVVDEPANTHRIAWILARSARAARASTPPDANTSWFCVPCGFTTRDAAEAQAHLGPHMIELTCPFDGQIWRFHTQAQADMLQKHLDWHAAQLSITTKE